MVVCRKYLQIAKVQLKLTLFINLLLAIAIVLLAPVLFGIKNLDSMASSMVLERYVSLTGVILCTPLFLPEQDSGIKELIESKYTSLTGTYIIRLGLALTSLLGMIGCFIAIMQLNECQFAAGPYLFGTFATAVFLGALGFAAYALADNVVVGYMLPLGYYMLNTFAPDKLSHFQLFTLSTGSLNDKYWLSAGAALLLIAGIAYRLILRRIR
ncbi:hypothetical protein [Paenibacillus donghaensis]|uniref:Uncharacterized protein n=1 Tax=Paenibacillus donghaensis TaxID=414771 RepID=A0A2Z2KR24_9BACL|nr:hypothetical protein [Paenibacillus donghaensis]ASA23842.1 hypothetical protein B9T62_25510 [Paenibacillus donghaensis]